MPLVWAMNTRLKGEHKLYDRVYGPSLMLEVLQATSNRPECSHFFLGGQQSTLDKLEAPAIVESIFQRIRIYFEAT